ncbi:UNVERIFIED_CONTAM: hypothetical protein RMT77_010236 [Armadillidium vulgare]
MGSFTYFNPHTTPLNVLNSIITKEVEINMGTKSQRGWIQSIDPISKSFIIMMFNDSSRCSEVTFIPGCNVKSVKIFETIPSGELRNKLNNVFKTEEVQFSKEEIEKRREDLCVWLSGNRVPYTVSNNLCIEVLQVATIKPPYNTESIHCKNEVVLDKVIKLVKTAGLDNRKDI